MDNISLFTHQDKKKRLCSESLMKWKSTVLDLAQQYSAWTRKNFAFHLYMTVLLSESLPDWLVTFHPENIKKGEDLH